MSARVYDTNGFVEILDNPISKPGIFEYLGSSIGAPEPDRIYRVWRPEEELNNPETIESFKLLPWIDDHAMLGSREDGLLPAEKKGVNGVIGERVKYSDGYLKGNLKIFSEGHQDLIDTGKRELSIGFRCRYDFTAGVFNNEHYDVIQRKIRGNHLASVDDGRMGADVAVMDHRETFTFDSKDLTMVDKTKETETGSDQDVPASEMTLSQLSEAVKNILPAITQMQEMMKTLGEKPADENAEAETGADEEEEEGKGMDEEKLKNAMDAALKPIHKELAALKKSQGVGMDSKSILTEMTKRDSLAGRLSPYIGTFDHSDKTLAEVEKYGVEKLGIACADGMEGALLEGFLLASKSNQNQSRAVYTGMDSSDGSDDPLSSYING